MGNRDSASNGCMMRSTPLAIWGADLSKEDLKKASNAETTLTHPNPTANDATFLYNLAIKFLLNNLEDPDRALKCFDYCLEASNSFTPEDSFFGDQSIKNWLLLSKKMFEDANESGEEELLKMPEVLTNQGWVKHALIMSFYFLLKSTKYEGDIFEYAMKISIQSGGDTDTNACIVGGMIGAHVGFTNLNKKYVGKIFGFDCTRAERIKRPEFLSTKLYAAKIILSLIERRAQ